MGFNYLTNSLFTFLTGDYIEGVTDLDRLATPALLRIFRKKMQDYVRKTKCDDLTSGQKEQVRDFYARYGGTDLLYHRVYTARSGRFFKEYIPDDIYFGHIEPYYSDRLTSKYLDNKCLYYCFFSNVRQPGLIAMRVGKYWLDSEFRLIGKDKLMDIIANNERFVVKKATDSEGGYGVEFLEGGERTDDFRRFIDKNKTDIVVQEEVRQHPAYARLNESSVNTLRLMSLLTKDGVKVLAGAVRIGTKGSRVDNLCHGGVFCGIDNSGRLTETGLLDDGSVIKKHPDHDYSFSDITLPYYDKARELVEKAHGIMGHCRLASWDIAIDEGGDAVLIETNLALGTIFSMQVCCGPLFGEDTKKILDEVFYDKKGNRRKRRYFGLNPRDYYYIRDNLLGVLYGYYKSGYTHINLLSNPALRVIDRRLVAEVAELFPELSDRQKKEAREYYKPYVKRFNMDSHRVYTGKYGSFYPDFIPEDLYMCDIDRYLSDRDLAYYLDNKCYYARLFPYALQPETIAMRIGGIWLDSSYNVISAREVRERLYASDEAVFKAANGSEAGASVHFVRFAETASHEEKKKLLKDTVRKLKSDIVIQKSLKQHKDMAMLHPQSINTIRIVSLLIDDEAVILSRSIRVGVGKSRVDNAGKGGILCGIGDDGCLNGIGTLEDGRVVHSHPDSGIGFKGWKIPSLKECEETVKRSHPILGHNRLVSWDLAVGEAGEVILIEANLALGSSHIIQEANGPFFGKYTKQVLEEVYGHA